VKDLVDKGFLIKERSPHDKRSTKVRLSEKGLDLCGKIDELYQRHVEMLKDGVPSIDQLKEVNGNLQQLEQFWSKYINNIFRMG
jgi:DNA-binding MarR family transcriptional regulator